jgi:hypothetical protein
MSHPQGQPCSWVQLQSLLQEMHTFSPTPCCCRCADIAGSLSHCKPLQLNLCIFVRDQYRAHTSVLAGIRAGIHRACCCICDAHITTHHHTAPHIYSMHHHTLVAEQRGLLRSGVLQVARSAAGQNLKQFVTKVELVGTLFTRLKICRHSTHSTAQHRTAHSTQRHLWKSTT